MNAFFRDKYVPIPSNYNLVLAMLWRHPENIELEKVKVVHYCANVSIYTTYKFHHISLEFCNKIVMVGFNVFLGF